MEILRIFRLRDALAKKGIKPRKMSSRIAQSCEIGQDTICAILGGQHELANLLRRDFAAAFTCIVEGDVSMSKLTRDALHAAGGEHVTLTPFPDMRAVLWEYENPNAQYLKRSTFWIFKNGIFEGEYDNTSLVYRGRHRSAAGVVARVLARIGAVGIWRFAEGE